PSAVNNKMQFLQYVLAFLLVLHSVKAYHILMVGRNSGPTYAEDGPVKYWLESLGHVVDYKADDDAKKADGEGKDIILVFVWKFQVLMCFADSFVIIF